VTRIPCPGIVELIEAGDTRSRRLGRLLDGYADAIRAAGADAVGLGCTHYPFVHGAIKRRLGRDVRLFEPSRAVARRVRQILIERDGLAPERAPAHRFTTTGDPEHFRRVARRLLRQPVIEVERWRETAPFPGPSPAA
jgi:glutamate racemase